MTTTDWIQALASILTMCAAFFALVIAVRAPKLAAEWAEKYRAQSEAAAERQKMRMAVFTAFMKCRSQILHPEAIAAINLVDVAFSDNSEVRNAHKSFLEATYIEPTQGTIIVERYHAMIEKIARAVGMSNEISIFDVKAGYYPSGLGRFDEAAFAEAEEKIARREALKAE